MIPDLEMSLSSDKLGNLAPVFTVHFQGLAKLLMLVLSPDYSTVRLIIHSFGYPVPIALLLCHLLILGLFSVFKIFFKCACWWIRLSLISIRLHLTSTLRLILLKPRVVLLCRLLAPITIYFIIFAWLLSLLSF